MNLTLNTLLIFLILLILSCKNQNKENEVQASNQNVIARNENREINTDKSQFDKIRIIEQLQGKWKEIEYPYRTAEFVNSRVKFVEEGMAGNPKYEAFYLSNECPFNNNNIRDLTSDDIILTLPESARCEKLMATQDTLTLSGFSSNTNENYHIIYLRMK